MITNGCLVPFQSFNDYQRLPSSIPFNLQEGSDIHDHNTRSSKNYRSHRARIKVKQLSMLCIGPELWNKLPDSMKYDQSLGSFESLLKNVVRIKARKAASISAFRGCDSSCCCLSHSARR